MVTLEELKKSIDEERKKVKKAQEIEASIIEKSKLKKQLFELRHQKAIAARGKGIRLLKTAGKGLLKVGKKSLPLIKRQAQLIRDQQLRDEAIERRLSKGTKIKKPKVKKGKTKKVKSKKMKKKKSFTISFN